MHDEFEYTYILNNNFYKEFGFFRYFFKLGLIYDKIR